MFRPRKNAFHLCTTPSLVVSTASPTTVDRSSLSTPKASSSRLASSHDTSVPVMRASPVQPATDGDSGGSQHRLDVNSTADEDAYSSGGVSSRKLFFPSLLVHHFFMFVFVLLSISLFVRSLCRDSVTEVQHLCVQKSV